MDHRLQFQSLFLILLILLLNNTRFNCLEDKYSKTNKETTDRSANEIKEDVPFPTDENYLQTDDSDVDNRITTKKEKVYKPTVAPVEEKPEEETKENGYQHTTEKTPVRKSETVAKNVDPMDQYILNGILDIVDAKFETLNQRFLTLERGINNLQYYNVRSFRVVNTHLHAVDTTLHTLHEQVGEIQQQTRLFEQTIGALKDEVTVLQSENSDMIQAFEQKLLHVHRDLESKISAVKDDVERSNVHADQLKNITSLIRNNLELVAQKQEVMEQDVESTLALNSEIFQMAITITNSTHFLANNIHNVSELTKHINATLVTVSGNISILSSDSYDIKQSLVGALTNTTISSGTHENIKNEDEEISNLQYLRAPSSEVKTTCSKLLEVLDDKLKEISVTQVNQKNIDSNSMMNYNEEFKNQSAKLLRALATVNENVFQSVTLYKHTGDLIERIVADTEVIATEQVRLREELLAYLLNGTFDLFNQSIPEFTDSLTMVKESESGESSKPNISQSCALPKSIVDEILKISYNGSHLLELLTDLATSSSSSIKSSLDKLEQQVNRLSRVDQDKQTSPLSHKSDMFVRDDQKNIGGSYLKDIHNKTDWIYQLTEAIASNTGWIPYVFHNLRFVENQVNKTLKSITNVDKRTEEILTRQKATNVIGFKPNLQPESSSTQAPITNAPDRNEKNQAQVNKLKDDDSESQEEDELTANQNSVINHVLDYVYNINKKINRLIPALTNLLGEPEPYISLVDGNTDREGRVEIYHKGEWGTVAGEMGHIHASYICRKLGYLGGISAGRGYFGAGTGQFWNLNVTCLRTRWCSAVTHVVNPTMYNHSQDLGIICDHMLRLAPDEDEEEVQRRTGKLEIYHQNAWFPICAKGWGKDETNVACKQLGFLEGSATAVKDESIPETSWMTGVTCKGSEDRLDACVFDSFEFNGCPDMKYVSLICS